MMQFNRHIVAKVALAVAIVMAIFCTATYAASMKRDDNQNLSRYLVLDSRVIEKAQNAKLTVGQTKKHPANPLFGEDEPWEKRYDNVYPRVIFDEEDQLYKCWYMPFIIDHSAKGMTLEEKKTKSYNPPTDRDEGICYAFSKDGIKWVKPELGLVEFLGNSKNNIAVRGPHGASVFKDMRDPDPARRFKAVVCMGDETRATSTMKHHVMFSADGVHWSKPIPCPETGLIGDSANNALWAPELGEYVCYTRLSGIGEDATLLEGDGHKREIRQLGRMTSKDFVNWTKAELCMQGLELNYQIYCMPVFRYGGVYIGLPVIYDIKADRAWTELAWSPDTINWNRIDPGTPLIGNSQKEGDYDWGCVYPAASPVFLDDEIRLYYGGSDYTHMGWREAYFCLATLRPDGFAGYEPTSTDAQAVITTKPLKGYFASLRITADVLRPGGSVEVAVVDERGREYARSKSINESLTDGRVTWKSGWDVAVLNCAEIRLKFVFRNAKLYSFQIQ